MKKFLILIINVFLLLTLLSPLNGESMTISGGVSMTDIVPDGFFGNWKVLAYRVHTTNENMFAPYSVELWNISKNNNVITLTNPISGASASITVQNATEKSFTFQRVTGDKNETVTETANLNLNGSNFTGIDTMVVKYYKNGLMIKSEKVEYKLKAYKIN